MTMPNIMDDFISVNIETIEIQTLAEISSLELHHALPKEKRLDYVWERLGNPLCFRYGNMGIKLEFDDNAPSIQTVLTNFLIRKNSGL